MKKVQTIIRDNIDYNRLYVVGIKESPKLLLVAYINDFLTDGYIILDKSYITDIRQTKTDLFLTQILKIEKTYPKPPPLILNINIGSWRSVFKCIIGEFISIENESNDEYWWGKIIKYDENG